MPDIKTREIAKGTVKAIDKSAVAAERMKSAIFAPKTKRITAFIPQRVRPMNTPPTVFREGRKPPPVKPSAGLINSGARV